MMAMMENSSAAYKKRFVEYFTHYTDNCPKSAQMMGGNQNRAQKTVLTRKEQYNDPKARQSVNKGQSNASK